MNDPLLFLVVLTTAVVPIAFVFYLAYSATVERERRAKGINPDRLAGAIRRMRNGT